LKEFVLLHQRYRRDKQVHLVTEAVSYVTAKMLRAVAARYEAAKTLKALDKAARQALRPIPKKK
jgi:hypothetical protein